MLKLEKLVRVSGPNPRSSLMLYHVSHTPNWYFVTHGPIIQCAYCKGHLYSASCDKVKDFKARKDILLKNGCCFNCLKAYHKLKDCCSPKLVSTVTSNTISQSVLVVYQLKLNPLYLNLSRRNLWLLRAIRIHKVITIWVMPQTQDNLRVAFCSRQLRQ